MSAQPSLHTASDALDAATVRKRDRPPALTLDSADAKAASDVEIRHQLPNGNIDNNARQPRFQASPAAEKLGQALESESEDPRSTSATSSLAYYFSNPSEDDSPALVNMDVTLDSATTEMHLISGPVTPARDPAGIDRQGLIGVGELATPRWARGPRHETSGEDKRENDDVDDGNDLMVDNDENDGPDSPWTIEAVNSGSDEKDEPTEVVPIVRTIRPRPSMTSESGGEEILYPRNIHAMDISKHPHPSEPLKPHEESPFPSPSELPPIELEPPLHPAPPSAFAPMRKAKKRSSDEFEIDNAGTLVIKHDVSSGGPKDKGKDERVSARKHRSLGLGISSNVVSPREKGKERRRDTIGLSTSATPKAITTGRVDKHTRQTSVSSTSSSHADALAAPRRVHATDFSHLPPSPSSSSIQQFLQHTTGTNSTTMPLHPSSRDTSTHSAHVAHAVLRGTQEGWSGMDDEVTAEALRKLDGLSGKGARARASVGSLSRSASLSRPGTPAKAGTGPQWEGIEGGKSSRRGSAHNRESVSGKKDAKENFTGFSDLLQEPELLGSAITSSDDQHPTGSTAVTDRTPKKHSTTSARSSFTPKRGSASSTNYNSTPTTTSSRDSTQLSSATSATSVSTPSGRHSTGKARRNSAGSDISNAAYSSDATSLRERAVSLSAGDIPEDEMVPPVPPLPKDLSGYKSPPQSSASLAFPSLGEENNKGFSEESELDRTISLEVPNRRNSSSKHSSSLAHSYRQSQQYSPNIGSLSASDTAPPVTRTPSKKWSFSNALNIKLSSSPSSSSLKESSVLKSSSFPLSPRSATFGSRKSISKDRVPSPSTASPKQSWSPIQADAMVSAASLASLSSVGSGKSSRYPAKTPDRLPSPRETESRTSNHTTSALPIPQQTPLSPNPDIRRQSQKRLTPSSIPFFRRSSSQSMHIPTSSALPMSGSPTLSSSSQLRVKASSSPPKDSNSPSQSTPGSTQKKSSVLSLGIPSLLKGSSSRRSLHGDKSDTKDSSTESKRAKEAEKAERETAKETAKIQKEKQRKEDKDRSESRISVMMGRKRGKTLSSTDPKKPKPLELPPMQMSAITPATAQRVASLKSSSSNSSLSTPSPPTRTASATSSRLTAQTASSAQKQADISLRGRGQLPTIAGSPSVGTSHSSRDPKDMPPPLLPHSISSNVKETPTRIPRISSRTSAVGSPTLKNSGLVERRASLNISGLVAGSMDPSPTPGEASINEFGILENGDKSLLKSTASIHRQSVRGSPSSRVPRQATATSSGAPTPKKPNRDSVTFASFRKASVGSVASASSVAPSEPHHRFSALSPSKGFKMLTPKMSLPAARSSASQSIHHGNNSPSSSRQSLSTPSPSPSSVDEDELLGDEEMMHYIRRQQTKKIANGASKKELDDLLAFPDPLPPVQPSSPHAILDSSQVQYLSHFERKEILEFPSVYCIGARSKKKPAILENTTNNFGYDDERGDYLVVNHDHLAYRYEIIDLLGKGSFGQVLHCRDHCTGESVAIKIIRNKKRFHHQALVEIKILDNLRKWDHEEKHHVIRMTEHFYFRSHLCIAMELLSINLYELIKANGFVGFTTALIRRFTSQMLMSLQLMRHHRIVHCDLKPENVLLRHPAKSAIKVIDFGSSCFEHEKIYTYIQSRFYRSPEVILGMNYHMAIDIWSLGCILAELYTGFPIFPGENEQEQLSCIMEVLGVPDKDFVNKSSRKRIFFDNHGGPRPVVNSKGRRRRPGTKSLGQVLRCNDEEFVDFISKCLTWDPEKRIKPQAAMRHPFVAGGRRTRVISPSPAKALLSSASLSSRTKPVAETPKKSQISAPTPLASRTSRTATNALPSTPSNSSIHSSTLGSSARYRSSQSQGLSASHFSSRTLNGYTSAASTK